MVPRWKIFGIFVLLWAEIPCVLSAEKARSTSLSMTLKRKLKHHRHNITLSSPTLSTITKAEDDGKEFILRVRVELFHLTHFYFYFSCMFSDRNITALTEYLVRLCDGTRLGNTTPKGI